MNRWADMKVKSKLMTIIIFGCIGMLVISLLGALNMNRMNRHLSEMYGGVSKVALFQAAKSGEALMHILDQVNNVAMQVSQIATAAEEQTATTNEMSGNILMINEVVHNTAHGADQSVAAADKLAKLADELQQAVACFKVA